MNGGKILNMERGSSSALFFICIVEYICERESKQFEEGFINEDEC